MPQPIDDDSASGLRIEVERTGGIAGMRRRWRVEPSHREHDAWLGLIALCPWSPDASPAVAPSGADRFHWTIVVDDAGERRVAELAGDPDGPWRGLVDAVRTGHATPGTDATA
ncbi:MAG: hypothetical protein PGN24_00545 [Microbacterium arborescens]